MWILLSMLACGSSTTPADTLAAADAHDGATDHVVSECTGCGLMMAGDATHAVQHEGYELHFCSATCKATFEEDPAAGMEKLANAVK